MDFRGLFRRLGEFPNSGAPRPALGARVRAAILLPYVVFYRQIQGSEDVGVIRILHGSRKINRELLRGAAPRADPAGR